MWLLQGVAYTLLFLIFLLASAFVVYVVYLTHIRRKYSHIPSPPLDNLILGHLPSIKKKRDAGGIFELITHELSLEYGNVLVLWFLHLPMVCITGPDLVKREIVELNLPKPKYTYIMLQNVFGARVLGRGLVTECDHQIWLRKRMLLNPAFHRKYLMNLMYEFNSVSDKFIARIGRFADQGDAVNFADEFPRVTMDIIGKVAFNVDLNAIQDENCPLKLGNDLIMQGMQETFKDMFFWRMNVFMYPFQWKVIKAAKFIRDYGRSIITERIAAITDGKDTPNDILQHIVLMSRDDPSITLDDLVDEFVTFFFAGQETTSNLLAYSMYEIERNADIEKRLVQEVNTVLQEKQNVSYKDLGSLEYLGMILKESLRRHPIVPGLGRHTHEQIELGGYTIPAGSLISMNIIAEHWSEDSWSNPTVFDPDRFSDKNPDGFSYLPFSIGPRACIGKNLAQFESKVIIARLYQEFEFELVYPDQPMAYEAAITLRPKDGVWCKVRRRQQSHQGPH